MEIWLASADIVKNDNKCLTWRGVVFAHDKTSEMDKVEDYINNHMDVDTIMSIVCRDVEVIA